MVSKFLIQFVECFRMESWMNTDFIGVGLFSIYMLQFLYKLCRRKKILVSLLDGNSKYTLILALIFNIGSFYPIVGDCSIMYGVIFATYCYISFALITLAICNWDYKKVVWFFIDREKILFIKNIVDCIKNK